MNTEHSFNTALAPNPHPLDDLTDAEEYNFGHLQRFSTKPVFLLGADQRDVEIELSRLKKPEYHGLPHE